MDDLSSSRVRRIRRVGFLVFTLAMTALLVKLGSWQISRAEEKAALLAQLDTRKHTVLSMLDVNNTDLKGFGVALAGQFEGENSILLDNQTLNGQVGYRWIMPFQHQGHWILVELGWIAAPARRDELPALPPLDSNLVVKGVLDTPSDRVVLKQDISEDSWPLRVQSVEIDTLSAKTEKALLPWIVRATGIEDTQGRGVETKATPVWDPVVMLPEKHYAYAAQWFGLALVVVIGFLVWWRRGRL